MPGSVSEKIAAARKKIARRRNAKNKIVAPRRDMKPPNIGFMNLPEGTMSSRIDSWVVIAARISLNEMRDEPERHTQTHAFYAYKDPLGILNAAIEQFVYWFIEIRSGRKGHDHAIRANPLSGEDFGSIRQTDATTFYRIRAELDRTGIEWLPMLTAHYRYMVERAGADARMPNQVLSVIKNPRKLNALISQSGANQNDLPQVEDFFPVAATSRPDIFPALKSVWQRFGVMVKNRDHRYACETFVKYGMIPPAQARQLAGEQWWEERIRVSEDELLADGTPAPARKRPEEITVPPSCFACPGAEQETNTICQKCFFQSKCLLAASKVRQKVRDAFGTDNPIGDERRRQASERKRKQRERERRSGST